MVSAAQRYASFPTRIFGLKCSRHRANKIRKVLRYYEKRCGVRASKERTLTLLVALEEQVGDQDREVICEWLSSGEPAEVFIKRLNQIRGIEEDSEHDLVKALPSLEKECSTCMESMDLPSFPTQRLTVSCQHEPTACRTCVAQSINIQIPEVAWDQVQCPECPETLSFDTIKALASSEAFEM